MIGVYPLLVVTEPTAKKAAVAGQVTALASAPELACRPLSIDSIM
jgi:hypothetical protein